MNGIHDLGGMHGFGPVLREENEPVFHADWEKTIWAIQRGAGANRVYNTDEFRYSIERMNPAEYLATSYYEHWLAGIERLLVEKGVLTQAELEERTELYRDRPETPRPEREDPALVERLLRAVRRRGSTQREPAGTPRFAAGDPIVTRTISPVGHTRLPRYARGKRGTIERVYGTFVFPDTNAHGKGEQPQPVYSVRFDGAELWGADAEPNQVVLLDLWESYLDPA